MGEGVVSGEMNKSLVGVKSLLSLEAGWASESGGTTVSIREGSWQTGLFVGNLSGR